MRVLLTGGAGFIGHHVLEHILKKTLWDVVILDRLSYAGSLHRITDIEIYEKNKHRIQFVYHDLRAKISETVKSRIGDIDYILHLAAESHVDRSIEDPIPFVMSNVLGTTNLLNYAKDIGIKKIINFGTDEVFGPAERGVFYMEDDRWRPSNPYSASKCGQMAMGMAFQKTYNLPVIHTYTMNNFGERQNTEKFIPLVINKVLNKETVTIHGTACNIGSRCWLHARNTADALLYLLEFGEVGEGYNIVGDVELNNLTLAKKIADIIDRPLKYEFLDFHKTRPGHDRRYALSGAKIANLGWHPPLDFDKSLEKCITWYLKHKEWLK